MYNEPQQTVACLNEGGRARRHAAGVWMEQLPGADGRVGQDLQ